MPEVGQILSNLKRSEKNYDEELPTPAIEMTYDDREGTQQTIEAEQELFEENYRAAHERRWKGQQRWMGRRNEEMRLVNILHPHDVMRKLQSAGVDASIEPAVTWVWIPDDETGILVLRPKVRSTARLWLHDHVIYHKGTSETNAGRIGISAWINEGSERRVKCITSLQWDCGPEWSLMYFDALDVPIRERYRGWRTALLALITHDVLSEEEVDRAFGPVVENEASELYRETLQHYRARQRDGR
jgi:hypothetical protein